MAENSARARANRASFSALTPGLLVLDTDGLPWEDAASGEEKVRPEVVVDPARTLVLFDFDCTLTAVHLYHTLHGGQREASQARLRSDPAGFYADICGGARRVAALRTFLRDLHATGATLRILSFGHEAEIEHCLEGLEVRELFDAVHGQAAYADHGITGVRGSTQRMTALYLIQDAAAGAARGSPRGRSFDHLIFADDDRSNFPGAVANRRAVPQLFDAWTLNDDAPRALDAPAAAAAAAAAAAPGTVVVTWPAGECKNGAGLDARAFDRLLEFVRCGWGGGGGGSSSSSSGGGGGGGDGGGDGQ